MITAFLSSTRQFIHYIYFCSSARLCCRR